MAGDLLALLSLLALAVPGAALGGGPVERWGAALFAAAFVLMLSHRVVFGDAGPVALSVGIHGAILPALIRLTWKSPRPWPIYACGFQTLAVAAAVAGWVDGDMEPALRLALPTLFTCGAVAALAAGAWLPPDHGPDMK